DSPPPDDAPQNILVRISADNQIWFRDENGERRVDVRQVRSNIQTLRAALPKASVIIQADKKASAGTYIAVQDAALEADAPNVVLVPVSNCSADSVIQKKATSGGFFYGRFLRVLLSCS